jgi:hypothetical protein
MFRNGLVLYMWRSFQRVLTLSDTGERKIEKGARIQEELALIY